CMAAAQVSYPPAVTQTDLNAVIAAIPVAGTGSPTAVVDTNVGTPGPDNRFAPFMHTHPSKARKDRVLVSIIGYLDVTFKDSTGTASPFPSGVTPRCAVVAETTSGDTNVVNAQIDGTPTNTGMRIRITRTQ